MLPEVQIILPCYNPNDRWHLELLQFHQQSADFSISYIIVNDGSTSGEVEKQIEELRQSNVRLEYLSYPNNMGKGYALREGVRRSTAPFLLYTDIDFPFRDDSTMQVLATLCEGKADIVAGYRDEAYYLNKMSWFRRSLSRSFRFFMKKLLRMPVSDTQCGLKAFNQKGKEKFLSTRINRYLFDFEFIYTAVRDSRVSITTVPVFLKDNVTFSKMRLAVLVQETFNLLKVLFFRAR